MKALVVVCAVAFAVTGYAAGQDAQAVERTQLKTLTVRSTQFGRILFDGRGQALYAFTRDKRGGLSQCYGECAKAWPVYFKQGVPRAGDGVKQSEIGTTRRRDGRLQVTYNGWPLYFYAHEGRREVRCQNVVEFGGTWLVVKPSGAPVQ